MLNTIKKYYVLSKRLDKDNDYFSNDEFIEMLSSVPEPVYQDWKKNGPKEFPGLNVNNENWIQCFEGLMVYFKIVSNTKNQTMLVSLSADSVWHAWLRVNPGGLKEFQKKFFKKEMTHVEKKNMPGDKNSHNDAVTETWGVSTKLENRNIFSKNKKEFHIPYIFKLDKKINIPNGWIYAYDQGQVKVGQIKGNYTNFQPTTALTAMAFASLGWITMEEVEAAQRLKIVNESVTNSSTTTSSGGGCSSYVPDCSNSDSSSSSSDSGGSCGGSCGGGCGGG